jgi:DnaJ-class molecular chaperone
MMEEQGSKQDITEIVVDADDYYHILGNLLTEIEC